METLAWHTLSVPVLSHNDGRPLQVGKEYYDTHQRGLHGAYRVTDAFRHIPNPRYICLVSLRDITFDNGKRMSAEFRYVHDVRLITPEDITKLRRLLLHTHQQYRQRLAIYEQDVANAYIAGGTNIPAFADDYQTCCQRLARHLAFGQRQMIEHTEREWFLALPIVSSLAAPSVLAALPSNA